MLSATTALEGSTRTYAIVTTLDGAPHATGSSRTASRRPRSTMDQLSIVRPSGEGYDLGVNALPAVDGSGTQLMDSVTQSGS